MSEILNTEKGTYDLGDRFSVYKYFCQNFGFNSRDMSLLEQFFIKDYESILKSQEEIARLYTKYFESFKLQQKEIEKLQKQNEKLKQRLDVSIYFQNKAKDFIYHFEDCNALTDPDFYESDEACMCGLDAFAHNNHLAIEIGKETLKEIEDEK